MRTQSTISKRANATVNAKRYAEYKHSLNKHISVALAASDCFDADVFCYLYRELIFQLHELIILWCRLINPGAGFIWHQEMVFCLVICSDFIVILFWSRMCVSTDLDGYMLAINPDAWLFFNKIGDDLQWHSHRSCTRVAQTLKRMQKMRQFDLVAVVIHARLHYTLHFFNIFARSRCKLFVKHFGIFWQNVTTEQSTPSSMVAVWDMQKR